MSLTAWWVQAVTPDAAITYTAQDIRQAVTALSGGQGVCGPGDYLVSQRAAGANFSVDVAAGRAIVSGSSVAFQGSYTVTNTAVVNVTIPAAPPSGTRTHAVILHVYDKAADGGTAYAPAIEVLADTGSGTPALPASSILLATVTVTSTTTSITSPADARAYAFGRVAPLLHKSQRITTAGPVSNIPSAAVQVSGVGGSFTLTQPTRVLMWAEGQFYLGTPGNPIVAADSMGRLEIRLGGTSYRNIALQCPFANLGAHFSAGRDEFLSAGTYSIGLWLSKENFGTQTVSIDATVTPLQLRVMNLGLA